MSPSKPSLITTILYKSSPDLIFNLDYYLSHHIPFAVRSWKPHGLLNTYVAKPTPDSDYAYAITMEWEDEGSWERAQKAEKEMQDVMDDVKNFTNATPIFVVANVIG